MASARTWAREWRVLLEFIAGFGGTIFFHQPVLWLLKTAGLSSRGPFSMVPVPPFGIPAVISLAFWGGVRGLILIPLIERVKNDGAYWAAALLFGAIAPTAVAWFVVAPIKHQPVTFGLTGPIVNAAWGLGTAILFRFLARSR